MRAGYAVSAPPARTATGGAPGVASSAPRCAAESMPSAIPDTTGTPAPVRLRPSEVETSSPYGVARREPTLLVAFSETLDELAAFAASHGWSLAGIEIMDLSDLRRLVGEPGRQTMFHPAEIEFTEVIERIRARIRQFRPTRVVIDSISELCHLAGEGPRYRLHMEAPSP